MVVHRLFPTSRRQPDQGVVWRGAHPISQFTCMHHGAVGRCGQSSRWASTCTSELVAACSSASSALPEFWSLDINILAVVDPSPTCRGEHAACRAPTDFRVFSISVRCQVLSKASRAVISFRPQLVVKRNPFSHRQARQVAWLARDYGAEERLTGSLSARLLTCAFFFVPFFVFLQCVASCFVDRILLRVQTSDMSLISQPSAVGSPDPPLLPCRAEFATRITRRTVDRKELR